MHEINRSLAIIKPKRPYIKWANSLPIYDNANEPKKFILIDGIDHDYRHDLAKCKIVNDKIIEVLNN